MACTVAVRSALLRNTTVRRYASAVAAQNASIATPENKTLPNQIKVTTIETNSPIVQASIAFRAGSRNETYDTQGTLHHLRIAAGISSSRHTSFIVTRQTQQIGASITATTDRESIMYTIQSSKHDISNTLLLLETVATDQEFRPWEISDELPRIRYELSSIPETARVLELLHKVAYHTGLGYSLYSPKRQLGKISSETLQHYVNTWHTTSRCVVAATGISMEELSEFATQLPVAEADSANQAVDKPTKYYGGEVRKERASELATVALAVEGAGWKDDKDALAYAILQRALGTGPRVKWGSCASPAYKSIASAAGSDPFALSSFNAIYSDSGLFGFVLSAPPKIAGTLTAAVHKWLKSPKITDADISRGKAILKAEVLNAADNQSEMMQNLVQGVLIRGSATSPIAVASEIDSIPASQVTAIAGKLASKKPSLAAIGDLSTIPYVDQLN